MMQWRVVWLSVWLTLSLGLCALADDKNAEKPAAEKGDAAKPDGKDVPKPIAPQRPKPAVENPLQKLFQQLVPNPPQPAKPRAAIPKLPNVKPDVATDSAMRDHIDARAPKDRKQADLLKKAAAAIEKSDWPVALELLQALLGQDQDGVDQSAEDGWLSLRERALRLMQKLPAELVQSFRQRWGAEAQRRLEDAEQTGRADQVADVAIQFMLTDAGQAAADRLGARHLDRGEAVLATLWFRRLAEFNAPITQTRRWQLRAAMAAKLAGNESLAERWFNASGAPDESERIAMGGADVVVSDWWKTLKPKTVERLTLTEWPMFLGASSRAGTFAKATPLLLPRWQRALTQIQPIQRQIEMLVEDWHDVNRATVTVCQPLLVNGLVALRTLSGVQVFDLERGRPQWSTAERWPAESLVSSSPQAVVQTNVMNGNVWVNARFGIGQDSSGVGVDQNSLAQLLFLNGNFGQLSSDGRQLFVVEDDTVAGAAILNYWGADGDLSRRDLLRRNWSSNRLIAYDLKEGRRLWSVGGAATEEALQAELPGVFFFGAPTPDGDDLLIIGERDGEVRLFCLAGETGKLQWSQLLALAEVSIARDPVRRSFLAQVAISDGVVICPTTVGWLVAVDRVSHQLLWVHRYSKPQSAAVGQRMPNQALTQQLPWGHRWFPSAPVIVGDAVVYTPQETVEEQTNGARVVCVGLHNGQGRWAKPKASHWLALNGVADGKVLLVAHNQFVALSLADGKDVWNVPVPTGDGILTGLGCIAGDQWHLPLSSGQLWTIALKDGSLASRQWAPPQTVLGNLALYRGSLVSVHAAGMSCFEQREAISAQIQERKQRDPTDSQALVTEASILLRSRDSDAAWKVLQQVSEASVSAEFRSRYREVCRDVLTTVIQFRPEAHSAELPQLERLIDSPADRLNWQRLKLIELRGRNESAAALELLLEMARGDLDQTMILPAAPERSVRLLAWLSGQLAELWVVMSPEVRASVEPKLVTEIKRWSDESRAQAIALFGFHPTAQELRWREIDERVAEKDFSQAEFALLRVTESDDSREVAHAWQRLVELYRARELLEDAALAAQKLKALKETALPGETTAAKWVEQQMADGKLIEQTKSRTPDWGALKFRMERTSGTSNYIEQTQECSVSDTCWPYFMAERWQYQMVQTGVPSQRLVVTGLEQQRLDWSLPLRQKPTSQIGFGVAIRTVGHQMLMFHREVFHMLSPVDRRVVWTRPTESRANYFDPQQASRKIPQPLQATHEFVSRVADPADEAQRNGLLTLCSTELVAYRGRRSLTVVDAATGEWRWELRDVPNDARFQVTRDLIFISSIKWPSGLLLRARDGQQLPLDDTLRANFQNAKLLLGADLVLLSRTNAEVVVERWNPLRRATVWKQIFAASNQFAWLDSQTLASLGTDHSLNLLDLDTGEKRSLGQLKPADSTARNERRYVVADRDRVYLVVASEQQNGNNDLVSIPANGGITAFDRHAGGELWRQKVENQNLVIQQFAASPVLFFSTRRADQRPRFFNQFNQFNQQITSNLLLLDKRTGRKLFEESFPNAHGNYRALNLNLPERQWELLTYNDRVRIIGEEK